MPVYQVNYEAVFIEGPLKGKRYHKHETFETRSAAIEFASKDGYIICKCDKQGYIGDGFRQENSQLIDLRQYE